MGNSYSPLKYWTRRAVNKEPMQPVGMLQQSLVGMMRRLSNGTDTALEVGCGDGRIFKYLNDHGVTDAARYRVCDIIQDYVRICGVTFGLAGEVWDGLNLPYRDNSFDVVVCYAALHHIDPVKRGKCVREIFRVADEVAVIADYSPEKFREIHPSGYTVVDLDWLESELRKLGEFRKKISKGLNIYICEK